MSTLAAFDLSTVSDLFKAPAAGGSTFSFADVFNNAKAQAPSVLNAYLQKQVNKIQAKAAPKPAATAPAAPAAPAAVVRPDWSLGGLGMPLAAVALGGGAALLLRKKKGAARGNAR